MNHSKYFVIEQAFILAHEIFLSDFAECLEYKVIHIEAVR